MKITHRSFACSSVALAVCCLSFAAAAQQVANATILHAPEASKLLPDAVFYAGQSANTQLRNSAGVHFANGDYALAVLVDTSGYSTAVQQKYQGYLLTEAPLQLGGQTLAPGAYGFGFVGNQFLVMDIGNHDLLQAPAHRDEGLLHPMPLQVLAGESPGEWRLCSGRDCVGFQRAL